MDYACRKYQKARVFLMFSEVIEREVFLILLETLQISVKKNELMDKVED